MFFHFDFANYRKMLGLAWNEKNAKVRVYYLLVLLLAVPVVSSFHAVCFFLDWWLFPALRTTQVREPVFVIGHARSGTTLVHRLLSQDEGRFSAMMLYEMYFPSLLQKKVIRACAAFDRRKLGGFLEKRVQAWEEWRYGKFADVHKMGLTLHEEDDIVLYYAMASGFWITKMPYMGDLDFYYVDRWPEKKRKRLMEFYRDCIRRQLVLNGPERMHLAKNPVFAGRVEALIETFPDARFVVPVRNPYETIPSLLKLMRIGWKHLGWEEARQQRCLRILADQSFETYLYPLQALARHPETPSAIVDYRDVTSRPAAAIEKVYQELGLPMTPVYREKLLAADARASKHKTSHSYSLEEFGLDAEEIRTRLAPLFERFQWEAEGGA